MNGRFEDEPPEAYLGDYIAYGNEWYEIVRDSEGNVTGDRRILRGGESMRDRFLNPLVIPGYRHIPPHAINSPGYRKMEKRRGA